MPSFRWFDLLTGELKHGNPTNLRDIAFPDDPNTPQTVGRHRKRADVELLESNPDFSRWGFVSFYLVLEQVEASAGRVTTQPKILLADPTVVCNPPEPLP